jgi:hypothetical protein
VQQRIRGRRALDDSHLNIQPLTVVDRDIGEIRLQEREFRFPWCAAARNCLRASAWARRKRAICLGYLPTATRNIPPSK